MKKLLYYFAGILILLTVADSCVSKGPDIIYIISDHSAYSRWNCGERYKVDTTYNIVHAWFEKLMLESLGADTCYNIFKRFYEMKERNGERKDCGILPYLIIRIVDETLTTLTIPASDASDINIQRLNEVLQDTSYFKRIKERVEHGTRIVPFNPACPDDSLARVDKAERKLAPNIFSYTISLRPPIQIETMSKDKFMNWYVDSLDSILNMHIYYRLKLDGPTYDSRKHPLPLFKKSK